MRIAAEDIEGEEDYLANSKMCENVCAHTSAHLCLCACFFLCVIKSYKLRFPFKTKRLSLVSLPRFHTAKWTAIVLASRFWLFKWWTCLRKTFHRSIRLSYVKSTYCSCLWFDDLKQQAPTDLAEFETVWVQLCRNEVVVQCATTHNSDKQRHTARKNWFFLKEYILTHQLYWAVFSH